MDSTELRTTFDFSKEKGKGEIESLNAAVAAGILMFAAAGKVK